MSALLPTDASPEVPRHQAQQSQLAAYWRANGPAGRPICSSLPAARLGEVGRQPIQVSKVPAPGCSEPAGKLAGLAGIPICQPVPDERAGELGLGISGCQPVRSSKASEPWLSPSLCPTHPAPMSSEMLLTKVLSRRPGETQKGMNGCEHGTPEQGQDVRNAAYRWLRTWALGQTAWSGFQL